MELAFTVAKWIVGPVVGVLITVLLTEPLRERLLPLLTIWGSKKSEGVIGVWRAEFFFGDEQNSYVEIVELKHRFGLIVGRIVPSDENYPALRKVEHDKPLRVRGAVRDNQFFSGTWFHPLRRSHHTGTFDLLLNRGNFRMEGQWLGYSERRNQIESQAWVWTRVDEEELVANLLAVSNRGFHLGYYTANGGKGPSNASAEMEVRVVL